MQLHSRGCLFSRRFLGRPFSRLRQHFLFRGEALTGKLASMTVVTAPLAVVVTSITVQTASVSQRRSGHSGGYKQYK